MTNYKIDLTNLLKTKTRSKWDKGVKEYAESMLEDLGEFINDFSFNSYKELETLLLNGANSWRQYSWGGCSHIYNYQICEQLCTPSEQKRKRNGELQPNNHEGWLDVQARALNQACYLIYQTKKEDESHE